MLYFLSWGQIHENILKNIYLLNCYFHIFFLQLKNTIILYFQILDVFILARTIEAAHTDTGLIHSKGSTGKTERK